MPTVTRTIAKGILPRLRSPARPAKGKTKKAVLKRKAVDSDADTDESDGSDPTPRSKKRTKKRRQEVSPDNDVEIVDTDPEPNVEEVDDDEGSSCDDSEVSTTPFFQQKQLTT